MFRLLNLTTLMFCMVSFMPFLADASDGWMLKQRPAIATAEEKKEIMRMDGESKKIFESGSKKVTLNKDGTWRLEGMVKHSRLRCADYRVGVKFGSGDKKCSSPEWLTDTFYGTEQKHCNNAERPHFGSGHSERLKVNYNNYNCAKLLIECNGNCE